MAIGVNFDYTYNGILERDVTFCPGVEVPQISDLMRVIETAKYRIQAPLVGQIRNIVQAYTAGCDRTYSDGIDITNATVELRELEANLQWCKDDFEQTLNTGNNLAEAFLRDGVEEFNPTGTQIQTIIDDIVSEAVRHDTFRIFSFGDTSDADPNWNQVEGLWARVISQNTPGNAYCVRRTSTTLGTGTLAAGVALTALQEAYEESAIILKQVPNNRKFFAVTGSVYENLLASYESNTTGSERMFLNLVQGQGDQGTALTYRGIAVMPIYAWDEALELPGNPLFGTMEHAILYTTRDNHIAAINTASDAEGVTGWYSRDDRRYRVEAHYRMGYNFICCDLQTIAY